jgi:Amidohydrolase
MTTTRPPQVRAPELTCDCHFHIFGPYDRFPLDAGRTYTPGVALVPAYLAMAQAVGIGRMVVVQASVYGTQNEVTLDAVRQFGLDRARAVVVIDDSFSQAALRGMYDAGVRGVRFNMVSGNGTPEDQLDALARRLAPLGWHIQVYAEGDKLAEIAPQLAKLGLVAFAIVSVTSHWNEFLWPLMATSSPSTQVLTVGLASFTSGAEAGSEWGVIAAGTFFVAAPLLVVFVLFQRRFVASFTLSGIK